MLDIRTLKREALVQAERRVFIDDEFEPLLDRLLKALNTEASLNEVGVGFHGARLRFSDRIASGRPTVALRLVSSW